jgi:hypothetical protein
MKKLMLIIAVATTTAQASLIDMTPGGFNIAENPPPLFWQVLIIRQLAGANIYGNEVVWSPYEPFGPNEFFINAFGTEATLGWNLTSTDGFRLQFILVEGMQGFDHIYRPTDLFEGTGLVTVDEVHQLQAIVFFGTNQVPEAGATAVLLAFGIASILGFRIWAR